jgi:hypothetical protein
MQWPGRSRRQWRGTKSSRSFFQSWWSCTRSAQAGPRRSARHRPPVCGQACGLVCHMGMGEEIPSTGARMRRRAACCCRWATRRWGGGLWGCVKHCRKDWGLPEKQAHRTFSAIDCGAAQRPAPALPPVFSAGLPAGGPGRLR